jgi:hypothetical protein
LLKIIFSRSAEIAPPLATCLDDTLYELQEATKTAKNKFFVLVNTACLVSRLVKHVECTKFLIAFSPDLLWDEMATVHDHFEENNDEEP